MANSHSLATGMGKRKHLEHKVVEALCVDLHKPDIFFDFRVRRQPLVQDYFGDLVAAVKK